MNKSQPRQNYAILFIRLFVILLFGALSLLLSLDLVLWLGIPGLSNLLTKLGALLLLGSFGLLLVLGVAGLLKSIIKSVYRYFSSVQSAQRRVLFMQIKQQQLAQLHYYKAVKIRYLHELKRRRLLKLSDQRHLKSLAKAVHKELVQLKPVIPRTSFDDLKKQYGLYYKQRNVQALLRLQQKIADIQL